MPIVGFAVVGFVIAAYLALYQYGVVSTVCEPFFGNGSRKILTSDISRALERYTGLPITDAALGAFGYLMDAIAGLIGGKTRWFNLVLGIWLLVAPWILGHPSMAAVLNDLCVGALVVGLSFVPGKIRQNFDGGGPVCGVENSMGKRRDKGRIARHTLKSRRGS